MVKKQTKQPKQPKQPKRVKPVKSVKRVRQMKRSSIDDETINISHGPVQLDVEHARMWGWDEKTVEKVFKKIAKISSAATEAASKRRPDHWEKRADVTVFIGPVPKRTRCGFCSSHLLTEVRNVNGVVLAQCVMESQPFTEGVVEEDIAGELIDPDEFGHVNGGVNGAVE